MKPQLKLVDLQTPTSKTAPTKIVLQKGKGINNGKGFYNYTKKEAAEWEEAFKSFNHEIFQLAAQYPELNQ